MRELLGNRPEQYRRAEYWGRAVREVARYRTEQHADPETPGEPAGGPAAGSGGKPTASSNRCSDASGHVVARDAGRER